MISRMEHHQRYGNRIEYSHKRIDTVHIRIKCALRNAGIKPESWLVKLLAKCDVLVEAAKSVKLFAKRKGSQIEIYLGSPKQNPHGHVILCEKWQAIFYARGYKERRGMQNCCYITL